MSKLWMSWVPMGIAGIVACSGSVSPLPSVGTADANPADANPADANPDGSAGLTGRCCPAGDKTGNLVVGGYSETGICDDAGIWDNLCGYHRGTDARGCDAWLFDGSLSCGDAGAKGGKADAGAACVYAPNTNDPRCPAHYSFAGCSTACATPGLKCAYPGEGDGTSNGCFATAVKWCAVPVGQDAGPDGGATSWTCAQ